MNTQETDADRACLYIGMLRHLEGPEAVASEAIQNHVPVLAKALDCLEKAAKTLLTDEVAIDTLGSSGSRLASVLDDAHAAGNALDELSRSSNFGRQTVRKGEEFLNSGLYALERAAEALRKQHYPRFRAREQARSSQQGLTNEIRVTSMALDAAQAAVAGYYGNEGPKTELLKRFGRDDTAGSQVSTPTKLSTD